MSNVVRDVPEFERLIVDPCAVTEAILSANAYLPRSYTLPSKLRAEVSDGTLLARFRQTSDYVKNVNCGTAWRLLAYFPSEAHVLASHPVVACSFVHANGSSFDSFPTLSPGDVRKQTPDFVNNTGVALDVKVTTIGNFSRSFTSELGFPVTQPVLTVNATAVRGLYRRHACLATEVNVPPAVFLGVCDNTSRRVLFIDALEVIDNHLADSTLVNVDGNHVHLNFAKLSTMVELCKTPQQFADYLVARATSLGVDNRLTMVNNFARGGFTRVVDRNLVFDLPQVANGKLFRGFIGPNYNVRHGALYVNPETLDQLYDLGYALTNALEDREVLRTRVAAWFASMGVDVDVHQRDYGVKLNVNAFTPTYRTATVQSVNHSYVDMYELIGFDDVAATVNDCFDVFNPEVGDLVTVPVTTATGAGGQPRAMRMISMDVVQPWPTSMVNDVDW